MALEEDSGESVIPASEAQLEAWVAKFRYYREPPGKQDILDWLARFSPDHLPAAHKILDAVVLLSEGDIHRGYRDALRGLQGWSQNGNQREGRWFFAGFGGEGESGPAMLRLFREANGLSSNRWNGFFISMRDLPRLRLTAYDHVVFIDDFAGSGAQACDYWRIVEELIASEARCYLVLSAITSRAARAISEKTSLNIRTNHVLNDDEDLFHPASTTLSEEERRSIIDYGKIAWERWPKGYEDCGLTFVLSHKTPNNTIPILHANKPEWVGLFPRQLIRAA